MSDRLVLNAIARAELAIESLEAEVQKRDNEIARLEKVVESGSDQDTTEAADSEGDAC